MNVTRLDDARPYTAPKHFDCTALRLQGAEASPTEAFTVGLSHFLPGGGCEFDATPLEKVYIVVEGQVTVRTASEEVTLEKYDSVHLAANEARAIENRTNRPASMLVVMPFPKGSA